MPDPVYTGVIQDKGGAVYNVRGYGAVGNGTTDDTTAIRNAIAAVPDGGTLYIPTGKFRVTDTITINRPISILGSGPGSVIWLDLNSTTKTGVVIGLLIPVSGVSVSVAENQTYRNFGIFGAAGACRYGLGVYYVNRSRFENVHVRPGSSEHAVVVGGCLFDYFNFVIQGNSDDGYPSGAGYWQGAGIMVADLPTFTSTPSNNMPTNICVFDCIVEAGGGGSGGMAFQPQPQGGGNNEITGTYEGFTSGTGTVYGTGYALYIDGCLGFDLHDLHVEADINGSLIKNCGSFAVRQSGFFNWVDSNQQPQAERLKVENSSNFTIDRITVGSLEIDPACSRYEVSGIRGSKNAYSQPRKQDSFLSMVDDASQNSIVAASGMGPFTAENLVPNGDLSRWPLGFAAVGNVAPTLVRTTSAAERRFNRYGVKVSAPATTGGLFNRGILGIGVPDAEQYKFQPVTVWADIKRVSGAGISLAVVETDVMNFRNLGLVASTETEWVRVAVTYYPQKPWIIAILPLDDQGYTYILGGVGALVGVAAPMGVHSAPQSFQNGLQLLGKRIEYGSAAPASGEWQAGDIMFNLAPTAGGTMGWVCTAAGSPGTWKTFGAIAA